MKKLYTIVPIVFSLVLLSSCSKDFLKNYEERLEGGVWRLVDIDRRGMGGRIDHFDFERGEFTFFDNGRIEYDDLRGNTYTGTWNMRKYWTGNSCYTNEYGDRDCNNRRVRSLGITATNTLLPTTRTEYFDDIQFTGTNRFKAFIYSGYSTYIFRFRR